MKNAFNITTYEQTINTFPEITYDQFESLTKVKTRREIVKNNKILKTDAYNRTMTDLRGEDGMKEEVFTLAFRKNAAKEYTIIYGIKDKLLELFGTPITQYELDFAEAHFNAQKKKGGNGAFNKTMRQNIIDNHGGYIPLEIKAVQDGTPVKAFEPIMSIKGPGELAAYFEAVLLRIAFQSCVASDGLIINQLMYEGRIANIIDADEFGNRSVINNDHHFDAVEALIVGAGLEKTSNDAASAVYPQLRSSGTIAHRYLAAYPTEDAAFLNAVEKSDKIALLIDLIDSYQGIEKAIALKKKYRAAGKVIAMRLDSGNLLEQALYALKRQAEEGLIDPTHDKIILADISTTDDIEKVEHAVRAAGYNPRDFIHYGLGEMLVAKNKGRSRVSGAFKLTKTDGRNTGKKSNDMGKIPIPGELNIEITDTHRTIVQEDEPVQGKRLLTTVYKNGVLAYPNNDITYIDTCRKHLIENFNDITKISVRSTKTEEAITEVKEWFDGQSA